MTSAINRSIIAAATLVLCATACMHIEAGQSEKKTVGNKTELTAEAQERVRKAATAVGQILVRRLGDLENQKPTARGSAVVIRKDGIVATNYHVIAEDKSDRLYEEIYFSLPSEAGPSQQASKLYPLKVALVSRSKDLALLRVVSNADAPRSFPVVELGDSRAVKLLETIIVIGFPEKGGSTITVNSGMIEGCDLLANWIKTDARLIHGNSGGAAVTSDGKLIGIPTKILADRQPVDKDGDGFPDDYRWYGAVGFLRPAYLIETMLAELREIEAKAASGATDRNTGTPKLQINSQVSQSAQLFVVTGIVQSAVDKKMIAGARVGLTPIGTVEVTADNLLTWAGTNGEGFFKLNKAVPAGRYTLKAKAINYEACSLDIEVNKPTQLVIQLRPSQ